MANPQSSATELAGIIAGMIADATGKQKDRQFRRGVVDSTSGGFANVLVEGSPVVTQHVPLSCKVVAGDRVLVLSIGDSGTNLVVLANISGNMPIGEHVTGFTRNNPLSAGTFPISGYTMTRDPYNFYDPISGRLFNQSGTAALFKISSSVRFTDGAGERGLNFVGSGAFMHTAPDGGGRQSITVVDNIPLPAYASMDWQIYTSNGGSISYLSFDFERIG